MNYQNNIKHSYEYNVPSLESGLNATLLFFSDGTGGNIPNYDFGTNGYSLENYLGYVANYANREYSDRGNLISAELFFNNVGGFYSIQYFTAGIDYVIHGGTYIYQGRHYDNPLTDNIDSFIGYQTYPKELMQGGYDGFSEFEYIYYTMQLDSTKSVYDFSALNVPDYSTDTLTIRGENTSFLCHSLFKFPFNASPLYFAYGTPLSDKYNQGYQIGYSNGYAGGYVQGQDDGYQAGINSIGGNIGNQQATAFSYIGNAFGAVGNIMSLEVLPNVSLGLCFSIPMVFILIMTIFKLVRK